MDLRLILNVLKKRRELRAREHWSRSDLEAWQTASLRRLREHAYRTSAFYRDLHRGLESAPLSQLPIVTKADLMRNFDRVVADPTVHLSDVQRHVENLHGDDLFRGKYRVNTTSGTTGQKGIFLFDPEEWAWVIASYSRAYAWGGIQAGLLHRVRMAVVSSRVLWHQSTRVGLSVDSPWIPTLRLDALDPLPEIVTRLNEFQPDSLVAYAGMARVLAEEQIAGRLRVAPRAIHAASEALTDEARAKIKQAWGVSPFNVYGATETSGIASECSQHQGMHLYEDLVITEVVDDRNRPVPPGEYGAKVLVTVLFGRTLPLIRYEMSDSVAMSAGTCPCRLPFRLIAGVEGRAEDVLRLPSPGGTPVLVHPNVFHAVLERAPVKRWQIVQDGAAIRVRVQDPDRSFEARRLEGAVSDALRSVGANPGSVNVEVVDAIEASKIGKRKLIVASTAVGGHELRGIRT